MLGPLRQKAEDVAEIGPGLDREELTAREERREEGVDARSFGSVPPRSGRSRSYLLMCDCGFAYSWEAAVAVDCQPRSCLWPPRPNSAWVISSMVPAT